VLRFLYLLALILTTSVTYWISKSLCKVWLETYQGALLITLCIFDWNVCRILVLDGLLHPHNSIPFVQMGRSIALYMVSLLLLSRDSCERAFISQLMYGKSYYDSEPRSRDPSIKFYLLHLKLIYKFSLVGGCLCCEVLLLPDCYNQSTNQTPSTDDSSVGYCILLTAIRNKLYLKTFNDGISYFWLSCSVRGDNTRRTETQ